jgi:ABC-type multidrug transport system ATPase subunit
VRFDGVWLRYGRRSAWVIEDANLELRPGAAAVIGGRNGAGKTTLLSAAAGLLRPGRGSIVDRPGSVGWVPERFAANQPFTARGYLQLMGRVRGLSSRDSDAAVATWAERLSLTPHLDTKLSEVSKGTAQKVGLAQALLRLPDLLVLDEPWEGLDAQTRAEVPGIVSAVLADGGRVLISDHLGEVDRLPDAVRWTVAGGRVLVDRPLVADQAVIEIGVAAAAVDATVARLRSDGHRVLRVRA